MTDGATTPDLSVETRELWEEVRKLPKRQAQSVALFYVGQLTVEEIGDVLGCSPGTVKSHLFRARERLTERLNPWKEES
jgi:RNA polymerase sigma-70 factor (ECF subfamily)